MIEHTIDTLKDIEALCMIAILHQHSFGDIREDSVAEVIDLIDKRWGGEPNTKSAQEMADSFIEYLKSN